LVVHQTIHLLTIPQSRRAILHCLGVHSTTTPQAITTSCNISSGKMLLRVMPCPKSARSFFSCLLHAQNPLQAPNTAAAPATAAIAKLGCFGSRRGSRSSRGPIRRPHWA
jgi:hypothetical protein